MRTIKTLKGQTIIDIAIQEYGNIEAVMELVDNNPQLWGVNDYPAGSLVDDFCDFDLALPIMQGTKIYVDDDSSLMKMTIIKEMNGKQIISSYE